MLAEKMKKFENPPNFQETSKKLFQLLTLITYTRSNNVIKNSAHFRLVIIDIHGNLFEVCL